MAGGLCRGWPVRAGDAPDRRLPRAGRRRRRGAAAREFFLAARLHTRSDAFDVRAVEALPVADGKIDYRLPGSAAP